MTNLEELISYIRSDRVRRHTSDVDRVFSFYLYKVNLDQTIHHTNNRFIHLQLLLRSLVQMSMTDRNDFLQFYRDIYKENVNELALLDQLEKNYSSDQALFWYIRDTFISQTLNKALETSDIDLLYLFRFLLYDIRMQLDQHRCSTSIHVYRGQILSKDDLQRIQDSIGDLMTINSFLLTYLQRDKVIQDLKELEHGRRVLFEIDADPHLTGIQPFSQLKSLNLSHDDNEILFMVGSVFRIDHIQQQSNDFIIVQLTLCSIDDSTLKSLIPVFETSFDENDVHLLAYGDVLLRMGKLDESEKYYQRALKELSDEQHHELARCYYALGTIAMDKDQDVLSFDYHQKSLAIKKDIFNDRDANLADSYNSMGDLYRKKGDQSQTLEYYHQALQIWTEMNADKHAYKISMCLNNIGCVYGENKDYDKTLEYYRKALEIMQQYFPANHLCLGQAHNNIGSAYRALGQQELAIEHYQLSLKIKSKVLSPQHLSTASTLSNIAGVYEEINNLKQALIFYEQAAAIYRHRLPPNHPDYLRTQADIRRISNKLQS